MEPEIRIPSPDEIARGWESRWTPTQVARFWNWQNANPVTQELYYSKMVGRNVIEQASSVHPLGQTVVDYGAGPGYLTRELIARGHQVQAADVSPGSLEKLKGHLKDNPLFLGTALIGPYGVSLPDQSADTVFLLETIEHLDDELLAKTLTDIRRLLKPGGLLVITTPNAEDLNQSKVFCPNCGCVFHRVQHQRSFDSTLLKSTLEKFGFSVPHCQPTLFRNGSALKRILFRIAHKLRNGKLPHLMACALKP